MVGKSSRGVFVREHTLGGDENFREGGRTGVGLKNLRGRA